MNEVKPRLRASAFANERALIVVSEVGHRATVMDSSVPPHTLSSNASDDEMGQALGAALGSSRFLSAHEAKLFLNLDRVKKDYEAWVSMLLTRYGYASRKDLFKGMLNCAVESVGELIEIRPTVHEKLEAWSGEDIDESLYIHIPSNADASTLGAGLKLAFTRCKGRP